MKYLSKLGKDEIKETDYDLIIKVNVKDIKKEAIRVNVSENFLTVVDDSSEKKVLDYTLLLPHEQVLLDKIYYEIINNYLIIIIPKLNNKFMNKGNWNSTTKINSKVSNSVYKIKKTD
ncbi:MAG: Hsp20/alpha crystallin family protein [Ignavibacteria bacterium]|jgi:hypothetical protein